MPLAFHSRSSKALVPLLSTARNKRRPRRRDSLEECRESIVPAAHVGGTVFRADDNEVIPSDRATIDAKAFADEIRKVCRLFAGGKWIRNSSSGASGEADAFLPVKDRPR